MSSNTQIYKYMDFDDCGIYIANTGTIAISPGKKLNDVYHLLYECSNITRAQHNAQRGKGNRTEVRRFNRNILDNLTDLYFMLRDETFTPGEYRIKTIFEPKERNIMIAPFFPDRIIHHTVINVLGRFWEHKLIDSTYACIKGRGIHKCMTDVHLDLISDRKGTKYCLKLDIKKFYDNVDHSALKKIVRHSIADEQLLRLLDKIIDSNGMEKGLPIGNYTSQYFANLYLAYFDHWVKEDLKVKYYYRYMDDIVILDSNKGRLHHLLDMMGLYLATELKVEIKANWQIFPVDVRSIDFVGFKLNHYNILLRKGILKRYYAKLRRISKHNDIEDEVMLKHLFPSEYGWIIKCSEEHSEYIINNSLKNGSKCINYRIAG